MYSGGRGSDRSTSGTRETVREWFGGGGGGGGGS